MDAIQLQALLNRFRDLHVVVLGDAMLDAYTRGSVNRISPEGPAPVFDAQESKFCAGGAANTAANLAALGANVSLVSVIGNDAEGEQLLRLLQAQRVNTEHCIQSPSRRTLIKHRLLADTQLLMRVDQGTTQRLIARDQGELHELVRSQLRSCDLIVVSDYGYGIVTQLMIDSLNERRPRVALAVDSKSLQKFAAVRPDVVKPNYKQACELLGLKDKVETHERCHEMAACQSELLAITNARIVALTCDHDGCVCLQADKPPVCLGAKTCRHPGVIGAGDTFLSAIALGLTAGASVEVAAELATVAASLVVHKEGTATCTASEVMRTQVGMGRSWELHSLTAHLAEERRHGRRIVLTCGCFDILHHGHVEYLRRAKRLGDRLVVAVNTDESIRRLKGDERPINSLGDRLEVLAAIDCVDYLLTFDDDRPDSVITALRPTVFVKGGDYTRATLPEAELVERLGGQVHFIPMVANRSTTRIIDRILHGTNTAVPATAVPTAGTAS